MSKVESIFPDQVVSLYAGLPVRNYKAALTWYEQLLGCPPTFLVSDREAVWELVEHRSVFLEKMPKSVFLKCAAVALRGKKSTMREVFFNSAWYASQQEPLIHTLANTVRNLWERPSCPAFSPLDNRKEFFCMNEPKTTIDRRFSDTDAVATGWDETRRLLETAELFWIVTVRADGRPHVTPLVAVWLDGALHFCTAETEQKAVNLRKNPHVILAAGSIHWNAGIDVVVEGDAIQVTDEDMLTRLAKVWTTKWDGRWQYEIRDGAFHGEEVTIPVFSVTPTRVFAFAEGPCFGQTRHQF